MPTVNVFFTVSVVLVKKATVPRTVAVAKTAINNMIKNGFQNVTIVSMGNDLSRYEKDILVINPGNQMKNGHYSINVINSGIIEYATD